MKVQELKKECLASVGLSIEFSNSEIDSIVQLIMDLKLSIEKGYNDLSEMVEHTNQINSEFEKADQGVMGKANIDPDKATVTVDLKTLVRCRWLLNKITNNRADNPSSLFNQIDNEYSCMIKSINEGLI
jgi:hypothetical protein